MLDELARAYQRAGRIVPAVAEMVPLVAEVIVSVLPEIPALVSFNPPPCEFVFVHTTSSAVPVPSMTIGSVVVEDVDRNAAPFVTVQVMVVPVLEQVAFCFSGGDEQLTSFRP